jgi:SAM-dependent methyltransferase
MACGLPVITSAENGGAEINANGEDGFVLSDPRDASELARILEHLHRLPSFRKNIGENAWLKARQYGWDRHARETQVFLLEAHQRRGMQMKSAERWRESQSAESEFWSGIATSDETIRRVLGDNRAIADRIRAWVPIPPRRAIEIGIGGLGVGALGFIPDYPVRIGLDPLPPAPLACTDSTRKEVLSLRGPLSLVAAVGEAIPLRKCSMDLAICCNVLDHVKDPTAVIAETHRILRSGGLFFLEVHTFSLAGRLKWNLWTRHKHAEEILVRAHPYRFSVGQIQMLLRRKGFQVLRENEPNLFARLLGHSRAYTILAIKKMN